MRLVVVMGAMRRRSSMSKDAREARAMMIIAIG